MTVATMPSRGRSAPLSMASMAWVPASPSIPFKVPRTWPCTASAPKKRPAIAIAIRDQRSEREHGVIGERRAQARILVLGPLADRLSSGVSHAGIVFHSSVANCLRHGGHPPSRQNPDGTNPDRTRASGPGDFLAGRMRIFRRASVRSIRNAPPGSRADSCSSAAKDLGALVIYPTHVMPVRRAQKQNWNKSDASEVGARSGDNQ